MSDPGWDDDFNPFSGGGTEKSPQKSTDETEEEEGSPKNKKMKTHISKKEKKALDKLETEEIAREEMNAVGILMIVGVYSSRKSQDFEIF